jgi:beta-lactam-binding protein with PASTA domain
MREARAKLRAVGLHAVVGGFVGGPTGRVVSQAPLPGVAAAPGLEVRLTVARG